MHYSRKNCPATYFCPGCGETHFDSDFVCVEIKRAFCSGKCWTLHTKEKWQQKKKLSCVHLDKTTITKKVKAQ